jgi:phosphoglycolate phosphatase
MVKAVLFDLDGTLTDSMEGIVNSMIYALTKMGLPVPERAAVRPYIGPPLRQGLRTLGVAEGDIERAVACYREYFGVTGLFENAVYPGVRELLEALKAGGLRLAVATSKAAPYAEQILEHFGLKHYFDFISGAEMDGRRSGKTEVIVHALKTCGFDPKATVMVGDRENDVAGAKEAGLRSCVAVLYGYGSRAELEAAGANLFAETPGDIITLLT